MKVAFLHTPYYHQGYMENLYFASNNFGVFPPLGMMYASSVLKNNGHETEIIDVKAEDLSREDTLEELREFNPDLVGVMVIPYTAGISLSWAEFIKENLDVEIVAGNYAMVHYPEAVVSNDFIDYGIVGSAREALPRLLDELESSEKNLEEIEGLALKKEGEVLVNRPQQKTENLDKLPWPDRDSINNNLYHSMASKKKPFTILITSYGCVFNCDFCDMGDFGYSERSPQDVVDEIEYCIEQYGIKEIDLFDRDFLINKQRSKQICQEIVERGLDIQWSCRTRVDQVDDETLSLMKQAGCRLILYGVESGDQEILDREHKGISVEQIRTAFQLTKENGIETLGFFIIGHPGETEDQIKKTIELAKELPLDYAQFFKMSGKPGAKLYEEIKEELGYDYFEQFIRGEEQERDLPRPWTDLTNQEIEQWVLRAYKSFYLRPSYIWGRLVNLKSLSEFLRYAKVGLKLLSTSIFWTED